MREVDLSALALRLRARHALLIAAGTILGVKLLRIGRWLVYGSGRWLWWTPRGITLPPVVPVSRFHSFRHISVQRQFPLYVSFTFLVAQLTVVPCLAAIPVLEAVWPCHQDPSLPTRAMGVRLRPVGRQVGHRGRPVAGPGGVAKSAVAVFALLELHWRAQHVLEAAHNSRIHPWLPCEPEGGC